MSALSNLGGLLILGLGAFLLYRGLPRNGQVQAVAAGALGEVYTFAILLCLVFGAALILRTILG